MRSGALAFAAVFLACLAGVLLLGLTRESDLVYSLGVAPGSPVGPIQPGQRACQGPVRLPDDAEFDRVALTIGTYFKPGPAVRVEVVDDRSGRRLAQGDLPGGYPDIAQAPVHVIDVGRVATRAPLQVCLRNLGSRPVAVYGQNGAASPRTIVRVDGKPFNLDMAITRNREERSLSALLPQMAERAWLCRAGWGGPFTYGVLGLLVLLAVPLLLVRGLARAAAEDA